MPASPKAKLVPVKFLKPWQVYNAGEIAGFTKPVAERLVEEKIAEPVDTKPAK